MRRGVYSLDAYRVVLADPQIQATFTYSLVMALLTIIFGVLLAVAGIIWGFTITRQEGMYQQNKVAIHSDDAKDVSLIEN
jgi:ABC-type spermidine/putrescine transport system permease subunit II